MTKIWPERHAQFKTIYEQNGRKTIPFGAAQTSVAYISEYPPGFTVDGVSCEDMMDHLSDTHDLNSCEIKPEKNSGLNGIWTRTHDLRYQCSALPTELSSQLGAGHIVSSQYTLRCWRVQGIYERSYKLERWLENENENLPVLRAQKGVTILSLSRHESSALMWAVIPSCVADKELLPSVLTKTLH